jgi:hypothetical protein
MTSSMFLLLLTCIASPVLARILWLVERNARARRHEQLRSLVDKRVATAGKFVLFLSIYFNLIGLTMSCAVFFPLEHFAASSYLETDMSVVVTCLHGGFILGGAANYLKTGNPRYITLLMSVCTFLCFPSSVATAIALAYVVQHGVPALALLFLASSVLVLCLGCAMTTARAWSASVNATSREFPAIFQEPLLRASVLRVETRLKQSSTLGLGAVFCCVPRWTESGQNVILSRLRHRLQCCLALEVIVLLAVQLLYIFLRTRHCVVVAGVSFDAFLWALVHACNMSIHLGWVWGNGFHALRSLNVESLNLFLANKSIFTPLHVLQLVGLAVFRPPELFQASVTATTGPRILAAVLLASNCAVLLATLQLTRALRWLLLSHQVILSVACSRVLPFLGFR